VSIFRFLYTVFLSWLHFVRNKLYKLYIEGKAVCAHSVRVALNTLLSFYILFTKTSETTVVSLWNCLSHTLHISIVFSSTKRRNLTLVLWSAS